MCMCVCGRARHRCLGAVNRIVEELLATKPAEWRAFPRTLCDPRMPCCRKVEISLMVAKKIKMKKIQDCCLWFAKKCCGGGVNVVVHF